MISLDASYYKRGDKVSVYFGRRWIPARIVSVVKEEEVRLAERSTSDSDNTPADRFALESISVMRVRAAFSLPHAIEFAQGRMSPIGTPIFWSFDPVDVLLHEHDPEWNPHTVEPFLKPDQYRVISGVPRATKYGINYPILHVGAYMSTEYYSPDDPVWTWDGHWIPAIVRNVPRRRVSVSYLYGHRDQKGNSAKSYPSSLIWPAICDYPNPIIELSDLHP